MREAMADAEVGDDVYGEDPTVGLLEKEFADLLGKETALFVPSGTMANQIAVRLLARNGTSIVAGASQHLVKYESDAATVNSGVAWSLVPDEEGIARACDVILAVAGGV